MKVSSEFLATTPSGSYTVLLAEPIYDPTAGAIYRLELDNVDLARALEGNPVVAVVGSTTQTLILNPDLIVAIEVL